MDLHLLTLRQPENMEEPNLLPLLADGFAFGGSEMKWFDPCSSAVLLRYLSKSDNCPDQVRSADA